MGDVGRILQRALEEAFGASSDSSDEALSPSKDGSLRILIIRCLAMRFGDLPDWATELGRLIRKAVCFGEINFDCGMELNCEDQQIDELIPLPFDILWREPLFDQLIANVYQPGEWFKSVVPLGSLLNVQLGICAHIDLLRFADGIAIISMESECVMHFSKADDVQGVCNVPVLLHPGSLVLMSGEARYNWKHEINRKPGFQFWKGKEILQQKRTSLTLRKLCPSPN
ncbi:hypothetical protein AXF42_Ash013611 [Apostasia shenzhenica]|uniref:Fe2OG dioxygenase domain-containing protein n=1 Tax=Apostasia shenzhenica TaxID=1088818 RepID=A0A2I0APF4_9ASPA|nr:hypothetical protein AXF42_Ash013611 [Apostasia shenzhenica]